jgi:hypothetical protein
MSQIFTPISHPDWSLLDMDTGEAVPLNAPPPDPQRWLEEPRLALTELGQMQNSQERAMDLLTEMGAASTNMRDLNQRLFGLTKDLGEGSIKQSWWGRFTGAQLLREARNGSLMADVQQTREFCDQQIDRLKLLQHSLTREVDSLKTQQAELTAQTGIVKQFFIKGLPASRARASLEPDELMRLSKKVDNIQMLTTALSLTASQCSLSLTQTQSLEDRFEEIKSVLLPIWRQRLSLERFGDQIHKARNK